MPIKKIPNNVSLYDAGDTLSFYTRNKKNHFLSESKLFDVLQDSIQALNRNYSVHLTVYPCIAVHVSFGLVNELAKHKTELQSVIQTVLEGQLRQT
jgi:hypothetical protein